MASDIVFVSMALLYATFLGFFSEKGYRMQSFFSTMKSETIHHLVSNQISYAEMVLLVQKYIKYYNQERISKDLNWMSPIQYRKIHS